MERKLLFVSVVLCLLNTVSSASMYLQGVGADHALSYTNDRFYSGVDKAFIGQSYDWSGVGRGSGGQWATMISPSYFISAYHYHPGSGDTLTFYAGNSASSPSYSFTVAGGILVPGSPDLYLGKLTTPIPASDNIATYPLWALGSTSAYAGKDMFIYGAPNRVGRNVITSATTAQVFYTFSASGGDGPDEAYLISGDSGGPSFGYYNGQLALVGVHWQNSGSTPYDGATCNDSYVPGYMSAIQANMAGETFDATSLASYTLNTSGGNWSARGSWSPATVPGATDTAVFNLGGGATVINVDATPTVASVNLIGAGTLTVNGNLLTVSGAVAVGAGQSLQGNGSLSARSFNVNGGTLGGALTLTGNVVSSGGRFTPGGATKMTVTGNVTLDPASVVSYRLGAPGGENDRISITGNLTLDGTLCVTALTGFGPAAGSPSATYTLFTCTGALTNNNPKIDMPPTQLNSVNGYNYTYSGVLVTTGTDVNLVVTLNGDANGDGTLDARDIDAIYKQYGTGAARRAAVLTELKNIFRTGLGDANLDHRTDSLDFQVLLNHWWNSGTWAQGDFSGDGVIDAMDFQVLLSNWDPVGTAQTSQVPEPASLSLLTLGALAMLRRRK